MQTNPQAAAGQFQPGDTLKLKVSNQSSTVAQKSLRVLFVKYSKRFTAEFHGVVTVAGGITYPIGTHSMKWQIDCFELAHRAQSQDKVQEVNVPLPFHGWDDLQEIQNQIMGWLVCNKTVKMDTGAIKAVEGYLFPVRKSDLGAWLFYNTSKTWHTGADSWIENHFRQATSEDIEAAILAGWSSLKSATGKDAASEVKAPECSQPAVSPMGYYCFVEGQNTPRFVHQTFDAAHNEAERLSMVAEGAKVHVCAIYATIHRPLPTRPQPQRSYAIGVSYNDDLPF